MAKLCALFVLAFTFVQSVYAQSINFNRNESIVVTEGGNTLKNPWAGGFNAVQFSDIDLDMDGVKDLFVFDRTGNTVITFINSGTANNVDYVHAPQYRDLFPADLHDWVLLVDYNCDGKEDIFTHSAGGFAIYLNTSQVGSGLSFQQMTNLLLSYQPPNNVNLFVSSVDIPAVCDLDNDGDMDILTFGVWGSHIEYHRNYSVENGYGCDSLDYELRNKCWGYFSEDANTNAVNLDDSCDFNVTNPELTQSQWEAITSGVNRAHTGSTLLALDLNDDGDKELLLGDVSFNNLVMITNGGDPTNAYGSAQDQTYPSSNTPANLNIFPAAFHVDVDNDNKRDLLVSPNTNNLSENAQSAWYYKNTGTDLAPIFNLQQNDFLQDGMIEVGEGAYPALYDYDGDGLQDLFVSNVGYYDAAINHDSKIALYKNVGTSSTPAFEFVTDDYENLSSVGLSFGLFPAFEDIDGDGDKDMMIGEETGKLHYFQNIAGAGNTADFVLAQANFEDFQGTTIDVGKNATPHFVDLDRDGDFDMLVGERNGNVNYFDNIGSPTSFSFRLMKDSIGDFDVSEYWNVVGNSVPFVYEDNNQYHMLVGSQSGYLHEFDNIEGNLMGTFNLVDSMYKNLNDGPQSSPALVDMTGDGVYDLFLGNYRGGISYFDGSTGNDIAENAPISDFSKVYPNPANDQVMVEIHPYIRGDINITIYNAVGQEVSKLSTNQHRISLSVNNLPNGIYYCRIENNDNADVSKLIIKH